MTGRIIKLGKGAKIKGGKVKIQPVYRDSSHAIRAKKSKKVTVMKSKPSLLPQRNFALSFQAYKKQIQDDTGTEPTTEQVMAEMQKFGWSFYDNYGKLNPEEVPE